MVISVHLYGSRHVITRLSVHVCHIELISVQQWVYTVMKNRNCRQSLGYGLKWKKKTTVHEMSTIVFYAFEETHQEFRTRRWRIAIRTNCSFITKFSIKTTNTWIKDQRIRSRPVLQTWKACLTETTNEWKHLNFPENLPRV